MTYVLDVPMNNGGRLLAEADKTDLPDDLQLASPSRTDGVVTRAKETLEHSLDQLKPALTALSDRLKAVGPDEFDVEFGLKLAAETGVVVAKGTSEVHFTVTLSWKRPRNANGTPTAGDANG